MSMHFLIAVLILSAVLVRPLPIAAQSATGARTFEGGPLSVTVFDGTGLANAQTALDFPIGAGQAVELISIPVNVKVPPSHRSFVVVQFVGHFQLPPIPVTIALDCTIDHQLNLGFGCGITPAADFDFSKLNPLPRSGAPNALVPATFLIRDLPSGTHQIGVRIEASTTALLNSGLFFTATSSLIVSVYAVKQD
jgi:hypothetical protein